MDKLRKRDAEYLRIKMQTMKEELLPNTYPINARDMSSALITCQHLIMYCEMAS